MYYALYRSVSSYTWRFSEPRSVQPAASDRSTQGGENLARSSRRLRTPSTPRLRA